jgi:hypothetical protein
VDSVALFLAGVVTGVCVGMVAALAFLRAGEDDPEHDEAEERTW